MRHSTVPVRYLYVPVPGADKQTLKSDTELTATVSILILKGNQGIV
jgi:hypothetical protein